MIETSRQFIIPINHSHNKCSNCGGDCCSNSQVIELSYIIEAKLDTKQIQYFCSGVCLAIFQLVLIMKNHYMDDAWFNTVIAMKDELEKSRIGE